MSTPSVYLRAAACPASLRPQQFGLWTIEQRTEPVGERDGVICRSGWQLKGASSSPASGSGLDATETCEATA